MSELLRVVYQPGERSNWDFKRSIPWRDPHRLALVKDVLAMSNLGGGYLVIGVDESGVDEASKYSGVSREDLPTWDPTDVCQFINNYADPPIELDVIHEPDEEKGRVFVVLVVPSHGKSPIFCARDAGDRSGIQVMRKGTIYIRTKNKSTETISTSNQWDELLRRCLLADRESLLKAFGEIVSVSTRQPDLGRSRAPNIEGLARQLRTDAMGRMSSGAKTANCREFLAWPRTGWGGVTVKDAERALASASRWDYRGWPFIFFIPHSGLSTEYTDHGLTGIETRPFAHEIRFDYWHFDYKAGALYTLNITREAEIGETGAIDPFWQAENIAEALITVSRLFHAFELPTDTLLNVELTYLNMKGVQIRSCRPAVSILQSPPFGGQALNFSLSESISTFGLEAAKMSGQIVEEMQHRMGKPTILPAASLAKAASKFLSAGRQINS